MGGLPHGRVVHAKIASDRPHDDLAGIQADADLQRGALEAPDVGRVAAQGSLHVERREACAHGVVLMC